MKECNRLHVEDLERGDRLHLRCEEDHRADWGGPRAFDITVRERYHTQRFGWVIRSEEPIGPDGDTLFYLRDDWAITAIDRAPSGEVIAALEAEVHRLRSGWIAEECELHDMMAKALGYSEYAPGEPGYSADRPQYITGDHTGMTLAAEAAKVLYEAVRDPSLVPWQLHEWARDPAHRATHYSQQCWDASLPVGWDPDEPPPHADCSGLEWGDGPCQCPCHREAQA